MKSLGTRSQEQHAQTTRPFFPKAFGRNTETPPFFAPATSIAPPNVQAESVEGDLKEREEAEQAGAGAEATSIQRAGGDLPVFPEDESTGPTIQAKLTVGAPNDHFEHEADAVADQVVQRVESNGAELGAAPLVQTKDAAGQEEEKDIRLRQVEAKEEGKPLQAKEAREGEAPATVRQGLEQTKSAGQAMAPSVRESMEEAFGRDFSDVCIHTGDIAQSMNRDLNARAFTHGHDVYFKDGELDTESREGRHLLAHELAHVAQQENGSAISNGIQRWFAADHGEMTQNLIGNEFKGIFSDDATQHTAFQSGQMDQSGCNYLQTIGTLSGKVVGKKSYLLSEDEARNHGEANLYLPKNIKGQKTALNEERMSFYMERAISLANEKNGITEQALIELGYALHVGQDRGAHDEGINGLGHDKPNWHPDDKSENNKGWNIAKAHSKNILHSFVNGLKDVPREQLKTVRLRNLAGPPPFSFASPSNLLSMPTQFYLGFSKDFIKDRHGLPFRLGGVFPTFYGSGIALLGKEGKSIAVDAQLGLRFMQITPRIYVDVVGGGILGVNFNDNSILGGVSAAVHMGYVGKDSDYVLMLKKIWDLAGDKNLLVIGVGARF